MMTESDARRILRGRLVFGDEQQIKAKVFLENVMSARLLISRCARCLGAGLDPEGYACVYCAAYFDLEVLLTVGVAPRERPI
jgi:hypothetical protein